MKSHEEPLHPHVVIFFWMRQFYCKKINFEDGLRFHICWKKTTLNMHAPLLEITKKLSNTFRTLSAWITLYLLTKLCGTLGPMGSS